VWNYPPVRRAPPLVRAPASLSSLAGKDGEEDAIVVGMRRVEPEGDGDDVIERFMYWPKDDTDDGDTKEQCTYEANDNDGH